MTVRRGPEGPFPVGRRRGRCYGGAVVSRRPLLLSVLAGGAILGVVAAAFAAAAPPHEMTPAPTTTAPRTTTAPATTVAPTGTAPTTPAAAPRPPRVRVGSSTLVFTGHGWGHGVGMSQWGAYGYAQHGWSYRQILAHYYTGTDDRQPPVDAVRVLLVEAAARSRARVGSRRGGSSTAAVRRLRCPPAGSRCRRRSWSPGRSASRRSPSSPARLRSCRRGRTAAPSRRPGGRKLQVVNSLPLEPYLDAVVGSEVPSELAARRRSRRRRSRPAPSRSPRSARSTRRSRSTSTRTRAARSTAASSPRRRRANTAVSATRAPGRALRRQGRETLFSASSGGTTVSAAEATGSPVPYLARCRIPTTRSPRTTTGARSLIDAAAAAKALQPGRAADRPDADPGAVGPHRDRDRGRPDDPDDADRRRRPAGARPALDVVQGRLAHARAAAGAGRLRAPSHADRDRAGARRGDARGEAPTGAWQRVAAVAPDPSASSRRRRPAEPTSYRLAAGTCRGRPCRSRSQPLVRAAVRGGAFTGTVAPGRLRCLRPASASRRHGLEEVAPVAVDRGGFTFGRAGGGHVPCAVCPGSRFRPGFSVGRARLALT